MKILVCISKTPDTTSKISFTDNNTKFDTSNVQYIINPYDEWYALVRAIELKEQNGDQLQVMNDWENSLEDIKNQLINLSKIVKNEWDKIDKQIPDLEKEKLEFISTFPDELKELYDNLKKRGLEIIAAYRNENQCGCCGVELTSSEIEQILESKFQQCSYCDGVVI